MTAPLVLVTRPAASGDRLGAALKSLGFAVAWVPTVAIEPVLPGSGMHRIVSSLADYDWVVVTSPNTVRALVAALGREWPGARLPSRPPRWAAVGPATVEALAAENVPVEVTPIRATGAALVYALRALDSLRGRRVLLPRSTAADAAIPQSFRLAGAHVDEVRAYRSIEAPETSLLAFAEVMEDPALAGVIVASGSAVRGAVRLANESGRLTRLLSTPLISIGPSTSAAARQLGLEPAAEAATPTAEAMADAVASILPRGARTLVSHLEAIR